MYFISSLPSRKNLSLILPLGTHVILALCKQPRKLTLIVLV